MFVLLALTFVLVLYYVKSRASMAATDEQTGRGDYNTFKI